MDIYMQDLFLSLVFISLILMCSSVVFSEVSWAFWICKCLLSSNLRNLQPLFLHFFSCANCVLPFFQDFDNINCKPFDIVPWSLRLFIFSLYFSAFFKLDNFQCFTIKSTIFSVIFILLYIPSSEFYSFLRF